jgi:7,8-dihydroneopterin aldolase/epimerase/oxygenase
MDKVFIEALEIEALIGVYDWERRSRQPLRFDIEMAFDNRKPAASDDIADALDYASACARLRALVSASADQLLETLAERCCRTLLSEFDAEDVMLKVSKLDVLPGVKGVGIKLYRTRGDYNL